MKPISKLIRSLIAGGLAVVLTSGIALAAAGAGTVTADSLRLRSEASTQAKTLAMAPKDSQVTLLEQVSDQWFKVSYNGTEGYMSALWLNVTASPTNEAAAQPMAQPMAQNTTAQSTAAQNTAELQGVVTDGPLNVRSGPGTNYSKVGSLRKGAKLTITDAGTEGWYQITSGSLSGYVSAQYVTTDPAAIAAASAVKGFVTDGPLNVRSGPGTNYSRVGSLKRGAPVTILDDSISGWYQVSSGNITGYVSASYIGILGEGESALGASAAALAASLVGSRYVSGAKGPNAFDCSGLTYYIYRQLGCAMARGSSSQYNQNGYFVSSGDIQPGDLVFFFDPRFDYSGGRLPTTHVGIYMGNNQFIHSSTTTYRVQYDALYGSYYEPYIVGFKRIG